jgi:hypothetical protein
MRCDADELSSRKGEEFGEGKRVGGVEEGANGV